MGAFRKTYTHRPTGPIGLFTGSIHYADTVAPLEARQTEPPMGQKIAIVKDTAQKPTWKEIELERRLERVRRNGGMER